MTMIIPAEVGVSRVTAVFLRGLVYHAEHEEAA